MPSITGPPHPRHERFDYFAQLPAEIRWEIWKASLPCRIIPIASSWPCPGPSDDRIKRAWQRLPAIARVCREARLVALRYGELRWVEHISTGRLKRWFKAWIDPRADLIFLDNASDPFNIPKDILVDHVLGTAQQTRVVVISWSYINSHRIEETERLLASLHNPFVYVVHNYILHMTEAQAMQSGLFGAEGEQTTVLVDVDDKERLKRFAALCSQAEGNLFILQNHLKSLQDASLPEYMSFPYTIQQDFARIWLRLRRHAIPLYRDAKGDPRFETLYDRCGLLNLRHPLVQRAVDSMPRFKPMFTFQRCQNSQHLLI